MKPRSLKLSPKLEESLTSYATARGTSASSVVREALEVYLVDAQSAGRPQSFAARAADLAGCVDGPPDLSTNPAHIAAYGASTVGKPRARTRRGR
jgi:hypothetical protein